MMTLLSFIARSSNPKMILHHNALKAESDPFTILSGGFSPLFEGIFRLGFSFRYSPKAITTRAHQERE
jgi:hypothetical protein